jgi:hypothetical protein
MSRNNRSPKCRWDPLTRVPKVPPKRPYDYTEEENAVIARVHMEKQFAKKKPEHEAPIAKEKLMKIMKNLHQPEPRFESNYDRSVRKSTEASKEKLKKSSSASRKSGKLVP